MSWLYTKRGAVWQNLAPGSELHIELNTEDELVTPVLRFVTFYFGSPSGVASNSAVVLAVNSDSGLPTVAAYDSGVTGSTNPIYISLPVTVALPAINTGGGFDEILRVVNTSDSTANVDVSVSLWLLNGDSPPAVDVST